MWRIWNRLFGWHYVAVEFCGSMWVERVRTLPTGRLYVWIFGRFYDVDGEKSVLTSISDARPRGFVPLTWAPVTVGPRAEP